MIKAICFIFSLLLYAYPVFAAETVPASPEVSGEAVSATRNNTIDKEQVRQVLLEILQTDNVQNTGSGNTSNDSTEERASYDSDTLGRWQPTQTNKIVRQLSKLKAKLPELWDEVKVMFLFSTSPAEGLTGWQVVLTMLMHLALGLVLEYLATRSLLKRLYSYATAQERSFSLKVRFIIIRLFIQMLGLLILAVSTYVCALFYIKKNIYFELLFIEFLSAVILFRFGMLISRSILSPFFEPLRLLNIKDGTARRIYYWSIAFFAFYAVSGMVLTYLDEAGMNRSSIYILLIIITMIMNGIVLSAVWSMRHRITAMFVDKGTEVYKTGFAARFFAQYWPFFFTFWLLGIWVLWQYRMLQGQDELAETLTITWVITLVFPVADRVFNVLLKNVIRIPWLQSPQFAKRSGRFIRIVQSGFRIIMLAIAILTVLQAWGVNAIGMVMAEGGGIGDKIIDLLFISTMGYVLWELTHAVIERKLPEEESALASLEGDGGGTGASRAETLLPLIRTTLTVVLVIVFVLAVLHEMGIAITPLLAGAGVVGIAIGFGAQKLVQDILSGVFFLIDDAFRKGEYIEIENLRGTVEKISLRSMQLRHHLGAVQTIPYGEIKTVKNLSRDWITMKLELRLPYDTDIEKVRKIIKKVGQSMLQDEAMGSSFILPLKSQGVMRVEESALIVRMKFTTKPGEQWVVRREAYRRVRDALSDAGIYFAHREVRVLLPEAGMTESDEQEEPVAVAGSNKPEENNDHLQKVAAAAVTSMLAAEAAKHSLRDGDMDGGGDDR